MCQDKQNNVKPGELCKFYSSLFYSSSEPLANDLSTLSLFFDKDAIDHPNTHPPSICHGFPFPPPTITHSTSSPTSTPTWPNPPSSLFRSSFHPHQPTTGDTNPPASMLMKWQLPLHDLVARPARACICTSARPRVRACRHAQRQCDVVPVGARPTVVVLSLREVSARTHAHRALLAGYLAQSAITGRGKNVFRPNDSFFPVRRSARRLVTLNFLPFCGDASSAFSVRRNEGSNERESAHAHTHRHKHEDEDFIILRQYKYELITITNLVFFNNNKKTTKKKNKNKTNIISKKKRIFTDK